MSSRQMARAAVDGRKISFQWLAMDPRVVIDGYLVGMDDFHWLLFTVLDFNIILIHKTSPDLVVVEKESSLESQTKHLQDAVHGIGGGFFAFCKRQYLGNHA